MSLQMPRKGLAGLAILAAVVAASLAAASTSEAAVDRTATARSLPAGVPAGSVKLPASRVRRVGVVFCGRFNSVWYPGRRFVRNFFMRHDRQARIFTRKARRAESSRTKRRLRRLASRYRRLARVQKPICARLVPLRLRMNEAVGLALRESATVRRSSLRNTRAGSSSNLLALLPSGVLTNAVVAGTVTVDGVLIGPGNTVYLLFASPIDLGTSRPDPSGCLLARVARETGVPNCVDSGLRSINWDLGTLYNPPIQFDTAGGVVYTGIDSQGDTVVRRSANGTVTDLIDANNIYVFDFLALPDGSVVLTGRTEATENGWTRRISTAGQVQTLANGEARFLSLFPDGNVYFGLWGLNGRGVIRFLTGTSEIDPKPWISSSVPGQDPYNDIYPTCDYPRPTELEVFCGNEGSLTFGRLYETASGEVYALAGFEQSAALMRYYPSLEYVDTSLAGAIIAAASGNRLVVSGTDALGRYETIVYDTVARVESTVIGPDTEVEIYHLVTDRLSGRILFDGLRFSDNSYVIGEIDPETASFEFLDSVSSRLKDIEAFQISPVRTGDPTLTGPVFPALPPGAAP